MHETLTKLALFLLFFFFIIASRFCGGIAHAGTQTHAEEREGGGGGGQRRPLFGVPRGVLRVSALCISSKDAVVNNPNPKRYTTRRRRHVFCSKGERDEEKSAGDERRKRRRVQEQIGFCAGEERRRRRRRRVHPQEKEEDVKRGGREAKLEQIRVVPSVCGELPKVRSESGIVHFWHL